MKARSTFVLALGFGAALVTTTARAQQASPEQVTVAVFPTAAKDAAYRDFALTLDHVVLGALGEIGHVRVTTRPPMDLPSTQLAMDCIGETNACLRSVAERAAAESLIAPSIERVGEELVVTLLLFDARGEGALQSATRRHAGEDVERAILDAVPGMVRELYGVAAPSPPDAQSTEPAAEPLAYEDLAVEEPPLERSFFPTVPVVVTATGLGIVAAGAVFGLMAKATEDDYAAIAVDDEATAEAADEKLEKAETQALIANIGFGLGGAVVAVGVAMWIVELSDDPNEAGAWIAPRLAPGQVGFAVHGRFGGAR